MSDNNPLNLIRGLTLARLKRTVRLGFKSLWLHRLRSLLTVLGIVFGVCSVIAMLAIGEGASYEAQENIKTLGSQNIILRSAKPPEEQKVTDKGSQNYVMEYGLTYTDIKNIRATIPGVTIVLPARIIRDYAWNISRRVDCDLVGTVPWYPELRNHRVAAGRFFTDVDMDGKTSVCVLGAEMVPALFPLEAPVGKHVRVGGDYYQVIGVMEPRTEMIKPDESPESSKPAGQKMFIPLETAKMRYGEVLMRRRTGSFEAERVQLHEVTVKVASLEEVMTVADAIKQVLEHNHKKKDYKKELLQLLRKHEIEFDERYVFD